MSFSFHCCSLLRVSFFDHLYYQLFLSRFWCSVSSRLRSVSAPHRAVSISSFEALGVGEGGVGKEPKSPRAAESCAAALATEVPPGSVAARRGITAG